MERSRRRFPRLAHDFRAASRCEGFGEQRLLLFSAGTSNRSTADSAAQEGADLNPVCRTSRSHPSTMLYTDTSAFPWRSPCHRRHCSRPVDQTWASGRAGDHLRMADSKQSESTSEDGGPNTNSAGADGGSGIAWRMPLSWPGWSARAIHSLSVTRKACGIFKSWTLRARDLRVSLSLVGVPGALGVIVVGAFICKRSGPESVHLAFLGAHHRTVCEAVCGGRRAS